MITSNKDRGVHIEDIKTATLMLCEAENFHLHQADYFFRAFNRAGSHLPPGVGLLAYTPLQLFFQQMAQIHIADAFRAQKQLRDLESAADSMLEQREQTENE